jgi:hypothetical protein
MFAISLFTTPSFIPSKFSRSRANRLPKVDCRSLASHQVQVKKRLEALIGFHLCVFSDSERIRRI